MSPQVLMSQNVATRDGHCRENGITWHRICGSPQWRPTAGRQQPNPGWPVGRLTNGDRTVTLPLLSGLVTAEVTRQRPPFLFVACRKWHPSSLPA